MLKLKSLRWMVLGFCWLATPSWANIDQPMDTMPKVAVPEPVTVWPDGMATLWLQALNRPEVELKIAAANAIGRAHEQGMPGLEITGTRLTTLLKDTQQPSTVRLAAAEALIRLDNEQCQAALVQANLDGDTSMILLTDSGLGNYAVSNEDLKRKLHQVWIRRILDRQLPLVLRLSAARALNTTKEEPARTQFVKLMADPTQPAALRIQIANGMNLMQFRNAYPETMQPVIQAFKTMRDGSNIDRYVAVNLAGLLASTAYVDIDEDRWLVSFLDDPDSLVVQTAIDHLSRYGYHKDGTRRDNLTLLNEAQIKRLMNHPNVRVRYSIAHRFADSKNEQWFDWLTEMLNDPDPLNRKVIRNWLESRATPHELSNITPDQQQAIKQAVIQGTLKELNGDDWRGQEQAALLLGVLQHQTAAGRMIALLNSDRPEVRLAAIVGLRRLGDLANMPALLAHAQSLVDQDKLSDTDKKELSQINQTFGLLVYNTPEVQSLLGKFISKKSPFGIDARAAAIWALGRIHEAKPDRQLIANLNRRINDISPMNPEAEQVRAQSAIAIGRMKPQNAPGGIRKFSDPKESGLELAWACRWALQQITGEAQPPLEPAQVESRQWFLVPLK